MKRHLNTSYRLVWNHITGTLVVASELARSRGKRTGVAIALSLAAVTSVPALAADTVVQAGETVSGGTLTNHDNQIVLGTANGMTISAYFHERRSLNNFHRDRVITFEQIAE
ncbi:adhesin [Escherichia coli]|nr:adhesin [Escherichia coli]